MKQPHTKTESLKTFALWLTTLFLMVLGAKLWVVQLFGSPLPLWDQWYEAGTLFSPWMEGTLKLKDLFIPSNEHRIVFTKLLDMAVISTNGNWEPLLQMTVNCFIHAAFVCALALALWHFLGRKDGWLVCLLIAPFYALPYAAENTIWAINSQQYFMNLCALGTLIGLGFAQAGSLRWWLGFAAALAGLCTMASGFLAAATVAGLMILRSLKCWRLEKENALTFGACLIVIAFGASLNVSMPGDIPLRAHTPREFFTALAHNLAWPFMEHSNFMWLVPLLPLLLLLGFYFRKNFDSSRAAEFLLALGLWSALQSAAIAFGRANYGDGFPASRYMDVLNIFVIAGIFAVLLLQRSWMAGGLAKQLAPLLPLAFAGVMYYQLGAISGLVVDQLLKPTRMMNLIAEERVETFMATGDEKELFAQPTVRPDPKVILGILQSKELRPIMPAACLPPTAKHSPGWMTALANALIPHATLILGVGLALFAGLCGYGIARSTLGLSRENMVSLLALIAVVSTLGFVWSRSGITRRTVELEQQLHLANYFQIMNNPQRAAIHAAKAEALKK